jgi:hypothetical protein
MHLRCKNAVGKHNPATRCPNSRPNRDRLCALDTNQKGTGMTDQQQAIAEEREEIAARVANFRATQEKFQREREKYFVATLENARHSSERPPF